MEPVPLLEYALMVIFYVNDTENGRHPKPFRDLLTSADLELAFAEVGAYPIVNIDVSLDLVVSTLARHNVSAACGLVEAAQAVNRLRESKGIEYLIPDAVLEHLKRTIQSLTGHKRKYDELLDQTERDAQRRGQAKRVSETVGRQERARRRDGFRALDSQLNQKTRELSAAQDLLQRQQVYTTHLKRSLECQICQEESWDTVTGVATYSVPSTSNSGWKPILPGWRTVRVIWSCRNLVVRSAGWRCLRKTSNEYTYSLVNSPVVESHNDHFLDPQTEQGYFINKDSPKDDGALRTVNPLTKYSTSHVPKRSV